MPEAVFAVSTTQKLIALTIDDGPDPATTPAILELLDEYGAYATFFVIGEYLAGNERIVERIVGSGHELGNHMMADRASIRLSEQEFAAEMIEAHRLLSPFGDVHWLRPASGWYTPAMARLARRHGYRIVLGSIFPLDHLIPSSGFASKFIALNARPGRIIVLHDGGGRGRRTLRTLRHGLPNLLGMGYEIVTVGELLRRTGRLGTGAEGGAPSLPG